MKTFLLSFLLMAFAFSVEAQSSVNFTLHNTSVKSIPLWIPGVMNPNLSPLSKSGVELRVEQKVYFKSDGKKQLLFEVTADQDGQTLNVPKLIDAREDELKAAKEEKD